MGQVNVKHGNHIASPEGNSGYGFDDNGVPVIIDENGNETQLSTSTANAFNIVSNKGVGAEIDIPSSGLTTGDTYVSNDSFKYFIYNGTTWNYYNLVDSQFITDVSSVTELPPVYQYFNSILMPIANYVPEFTDPLPE